MNKKILTLAIATIAVAVFSCSKKEEDPKPTTTSTTSTTATTSTTSTTTPPIVYPTPGPMQLALDTELVDYEIAECLAITQGRYAMNGNMVGAFGNKFTATWGKAPSFTNNFTITPALPTAGSGTQIQVKIMLNSTEFIAQSGTVNYFTGPDSSGIKFTKLNFKAVDDSIVVSGFLKCP